MRNPLLFRFPVVFLLRFADRRFPGSLFQEPPRRTRRQEDGQAPGTARTTRLEKPLGASAMYSHALHGLSMIPPVGGHSRT